MIRITVRHQTQPGSEEVVDFNKDVITIGRHSDNDVVLGERTVSRKHARIEREGERYLIKDLESHFGVFVNKRKVQVEEITPGCEIYITPFIIRFDLIQDASQDQAVPEDADLTLGPTIAPGTGGFQPGPALEPAPPPPEAYPTDPTLPVETPPPVPEPPPLPPPMEPEPALSPVVESGPPPDDPLGELPGLQDSPDFPPFADADARDQAGEVAALEEDGTLLHWDGKGSGEPEGGVNSPTDSLGFDDEEPGPVPFEVDETPAPFESSPGPPPPPPPEPEPAVEKGSSVEPSGFKPWDSALIEEDEEEVLDEIVPRRRESEPLSILEQVRTTELVVGNRYGRIRGAILGFFLLLLPFFPIGASEGNVSFFWSLFDRGIFNPTLFPLLGAGVVGLLLIVASIFRPGLVRGLLQTLLAGVFIGLVLGVVFRGSLRWESESVEMASLLENYLLAGLVGGFFFVVLGSRIKVYHPQKIIPRLLCFVGGALILAAVFIPPKVVGAQGPSYFAALRQATEAAKLPVFLVVNIVLLFLLGLIALSTVLPWKSPIRSRLALLFAFYLLLYPLVYRGVEVFSAQTSNLDVVALVSGGRFYMIGFLALWVLFVGLASFLGNLLVILDYNEHLLLARS